MADDLNRRQMLAAMLAGAAPAGGGDVDSSDLDESPDTDAMPVPKSGPYVPLVNRPPNIEYSPPRGPPPWADSGNMLAAALAGGAPSPAGPPSPSAPPTGGGGAPPGTHYAQLPGPPLLLSGGEGNASIPEGVGSPTESPLAGIGRMLGIGGQAAAVPATAAPAAAASGASQQIAGRTADMEGGDQYTAYLKAHEAEAENHFNQAVTAARAAAASGNPAAAEAAQAWVNQANSYKAEVLKWQEEIGATLKQGSGALTDDERARVVAAGGDPAKYQDEGGKAALIPQEKEDARAPNEEETARLVAAGYNPKGYQVLHGKLEPIAPIKAANENSILGKDGQPVDDSLTGEALYNAVPRNVAIMGRGMAAGTIKLPNLTVRTDPVAKQAFLVASAANPDLLDVNKVAARREIETGYSRDTPGTLGGQVNAGNVAADHLADVVEAADDLKNVSGGGTPIIAHIANNLRNNITTGQAGKAGALEDGLLHYGEEIAKFYAGAQTGETERLRFLSSLGAAKSPEEMAGVFRMEARQLGGKLITLDEQVRQVMGDEGAKKYPIVRGATKANAGRITQGLSALDPTGPEAQGTRSPTDLWPTVGAIRGTAPAATSTSQKIRVFNRATGGFQ